MQPGRHMHTRTAVTLCDCDLTFLKKDDVQAIAEDYPFLMERIEALAAKRLQRDTIKLSRVVDETAKTLGISRD
eukprot:SAG22_NODE_20681_length_263_cov_1.268293_1_plen_73_part_01